MYTCTLLKIHAEYMLNSLFQTVCYLDLNLALHLSESLIYMEHHIMLRSYSINIANTLTVRLQFPQSFQVFKKCFNYEGYSHDLSSP